MKSGARPKNREFPRPRQLERQLSFKLFRSKTHVIFRTIQPSIQVEHYVYDFFDNHRNRNTYPRQEQLATVLKHSETDRLIDEFHRVESVLLLARCLVLTRIMPIRRITLTMMKMQSTIIPSTAPVYETGE